MSHNPMARHKAAATIQAKRALEIDGCAPEQVLIRNFPAQRRAFGEVLCELLTAHYPPNVASPQSDEVRESIESPPATKPQKWRPHSKLEPDERMGNAQIRDAMGEVAGMPYMAADGFGDAAGPTLERMAASLLHVATFCYDALAALDVEKIDEGTRQSWAGIVTAQQRKAQAVKARMRKSEEAKTS